MALACDAGAEALAVGEVVRVVGFGGASPAEPESTRRRRSGWASVIAVSASSFTTKPDPSQPCGGDSGGAALRRVGGATVLAGVVSSGDAACMTAANFVRADSARAWIESRLQPPSAAGCSLSAAATTEKATGLGAAIVAAAASLGARRRRRA